MQNIGLQYDNTQDVRDARRKMAKAQDINTMMLAVTSAMTQDNSTETHRTSDESSTEKAVDDAIVERP
ncbi:unnamed protein product [Sphagnum balticum]